jgi:hypothetical protein
MIISHMILMKSLVHNIFHHKTSVSKEKIMWTSNCPLYDYKMAIVLSDVGGWKWAPWNVVVAQFWKKNLIDSIGSFCLLLFRPLYLDKNVCIVFQHFTSSQLLQSKSLMRSKTC